MSAGFRAQIQAILPDVDLILANPPNYPVPPRNDLTDAQYFALIQTQLTQLKISEQNTTEISNDLSFAHDSWMSLRNNMTGTERTADNTVYDEFVVAHPYMDKAQQLKRIIRTFRTFRQSLEAALPSQPNQTTSLAICPKCHSQHLPEILPNLKVFGHNLKLPLVI